MSSAGGSVTRWLGRLRAGGPAAARQLWERYFRRLVGLARKRLHGAARRATDEEDVALSAFDSFCRSAEQGRFPDLADRDGLWRLLVVTDRKASNQREHATRQKRVPRGGNVLNEGALPPADSAGGSPLARLPSREPTPEYAAQVAETWRRLFGLLRDPELGTWR
jgi:hypothetical protein